MKKQQVQALAEDLILVKERMQNLKRECETCHGSESRVLSMILGISASEIGELAQVLKRASDEMEPPTKKS